MFDNETKKTYKVRYIEKSVNGSDTYLISDTETQKPRVLTITFNSYEEQFKLERRQEITVKSTGIFFRDYVLIDPPHNKIVDLI